MECNKQSYAVLMAYSFKRFELSHYPCFDGTDEAWCVVCVFFFPHSTRIMKKHPVKSFSSEEEAKIWCELNDIELALRNNG